MKHQSTAQEKPSLVIATGNPKKANEMLRILQALLPRWQFFTLQDFPTLPEPEEWGDTYEANVRIKALYYCERLRRMCLTDDAGLEIDALGGEPGVHSKRYAGEASPFSEKISTILKRIQNVPETKRTARFQCVVALAIPKDQTEPFGDCEVKIFSASCEGKIAFSPRGDKGFGYDPIFIPEGSLKTFAEMAPEEKDAVSHRGKALREVAQWLSKSYPASTERS
jgi:XTP/dITP diphosphohydrolase